MGVLVLVFWSWIASLQIPTQGTMRELWRPKHPGWPQQTSDDKRWQAMTSDQPSPSFSFFVWGPSVVRMLWISFFTHLGTSWSPLVQHGATRCKGVFWRSALHPWCSCSVHRRDVRLWDLGVPSFAENFASSIKGWMLEARDKGCPNHMGTLMIPVNHQNISESYIFHQNPTVDQIIFSWSFTPMSAHCRLSNGMVF